MGLDLKHRPKSFDRIIGNEDTVEALESYLTKKDLNHSFLFTGPSGTGKTTLARIVAGELGCEGMDFTEMNSADFRGIDTIRNIRQQMVFPPMEGKNRGWLLDEAHKLSNDAMNSLLKPLEEPPNHVYFFLATTEPQKLITTIRALKRDGEPGDFE